MMRSDILTWTAALDNLGEAWAARVEGKRFSMAVLDTKVLAATGRFFFSDGSSLEPSAGLFTPPTEEKYNIMKYPTLAQEKKQSVCLNLKKIK